MTYRRCRFWQKKIIFSDEAHSDLGGYVNKQSCRIWGTENPYAYDEKPTHPKRVTVGFWSTGIIGPFFSKNEQGEAVTVNGENESLFGEDFGTFVKPLVKYSCTQSIMCLKIGPIV